MFVNAEEFFDGCIELSEGVTILKEGRDSAHLYYLLIHDKVDGTVVENYDFLEFTEEITHGGDLKVEKINLILSLLKIDELILIHFDFFRFSSKGFDGHNILNDISKSIFLYQDILVVLFG